MGTNESSNICNEILESSLIEEKLNIIKLLLSGYVRLNIEPFNDIITVLQMFYLNNIHSMEYSFFIIKYCGTELDKFVMLSSNKTINSNRGLYEYCCK